MNEITQGPDGTVTYELLFVTLHQGANFVFPCDPNGTVDLNDLTDKARHNYLLARALVGRDFAAPRVVLRRGP
ncbi:hypothetical protein SAMN05216359_12221 [Roseateles sp. YR242]|uniref:hypothetical protein n=1 Tax=Roseateles sp. YR242 TaxID=1855305 RepID=UPI0008ABAE1D|nr:hypothetical protein [Roseateles sp. YR242]SEL89363.1 hypothetical protein SAMN05216359_12221 [Roseateles sp. YR242]